MENASVFFPSMKFPSLTMAPCNTSDVITATKPIKAVTPASASASGSCCTLSYTNIKENLHSLNKSGCSLNIIGGHAIYSYLYSKNNKLLSEYEENRFIYDDAGRNADGAGQ
jgi:hypothetical protein